MAKTSHARAHEGAADNSAKKQRGRPFPPGHSGNPAGMPKGTRHKATQMIEALFENEAEEIGRKAIERAKDGDATALRLVLERLAPVRRGRPIQFDLPSIDGLGDLPKVLGAVLAAVANGDVTTEEAVGIANVVEVKRRTIETAELEQRIAALEQRGQ